ncbi:stalk domain-containing protein [Paenibacillus flagellatus]|uniref:Copper amine oxidase n=1 Tax=Paenibacillus flagellatus TaxID=2211139 RepID=A0A2V5JWS3_9BACL|nr:stalk domain-containing protein [Paenibacillus flagellatus]PYI51168.1 copper amine oxidase [Paenibacillus flagellatus]
MQELTKPGHKKGKWVKGVTAVALAACLAVQPWIASLRAEAASAADSPVTMVSQDPLTYGAILRKYEWKFDRNKKPVTVTANLVEVDLQNPYVKLDTIAGTNGQFTKKQSVRNMANETKAVAAINGDFFNMYAEGVPMGPQIKDGKLMATTIDVPGWYSFALTKENKPVVDLFAFQGKIVAKDGASYPLGGINKTYYWYEDDGVHQEGVHSMIDGLYMYTSAWGQTNRSNDGVTVPTEVLVRNGIIAEIKPTGVLDMIAPEDGYILRASGKADEFVRQHLKVGDPIVADYKMMAQDPSKNYDVSSFKTMISGHTILVDNGAPAAFSRGGVQENAAVARTAIGYTKDERYAYLITVNPGVTLAELQQFMIKVGVWKGLNLDGGGSTQLATRPLGEFTTVLTSADMGYERPVVNGVGVYSLSPPGEVKDITIQGITTLFMGQKATFAMKAYDQFYNPVDTSKMPTVWTTDRPIGTFEGNTFTATGTGKAKLTVTSGTATQSVDVEVASGKDIASLKLQSSSTALLADSVYKLTANATTKSGKTGVVPAGALQWEFIGFKGRMEGDKLYVESIEPNATEGRVIARYDGFSTMLTMPIYEQRNVETFEKPSAVSFSATDGVKGSVGVTPSGTPTGGNALAIEYDFTQGTKTTAAYANFMNGLKVEGEPESISVKVKGDSSRNWIRAKIKDSAGKTQLVSLTEFANWSDWKTLSADLKPYNFTYPITLEQLYVANPENAHDERELKGRILLDDVGFQYNKSTNKPKNTVKLTIDQKTLTVNGSPLALDQAPVIYNGNTLVPVRFVIEAMGGDLKWSDAERKVSIVKDSHFLELWVDRTELIADGESVVAEVPPLLMTERTMVPLRIISEKMGWKVTWDEQTRTVTLE